MRNHLKQVSTCVMVVMAVTAFAVPAQADMNGLIPLFKTKKPVSKLQSKELAGDPVLLGGLSFQALRSSGRTAPQFSTAAEIGWEHHTRQSGMAADMLITDSQTPTLNFGYVWFKPAETVSVRAGVLALPVSSADPERYLAQPFLLDWGIWRLVPAAFGAEPGVECTVSDVFVDRLSVFVLKGQSVHVFSDPASGQYSENANYPVGAAVAQSWQSLGRIKQLQLSLLGIQGTWDSASQYTARFVNASLNAAVCCAEFRLDYSRLTRETGVQDVISQGLNSAMIANLDVFGDKKSETEIVLGYSQVANHVKSATEAYIQSTLYWDDHVRFRAAYAHIIESDDPLFYKRVSIQMGYEF